MFNKTTLLYPIFLTCTQFVEDDNYWKSLYEDFAYGQCPYGMFISNDYLCCNYKNRKFSYKINQNKNPHDFYLEINNILLNFGLQSKQDTLSNKSLSLNNTDFPNWKSIKKKSIKKSLIEKFIIEKSKQYNINEYTSRKLYNQIILGMLLKTILSSDVTCYNIDIYNINGLTFYEGGYKFDKDILDFKADVIII